MAVKRNARSSTRINAHGSHARRDIDTNRRGARDDGPRDMGANMSDFQVLGFLGRKIVQAMNDEDGDVSDVRKENFDYYVGKAQGDERAGYSKFQTREVLETIEWVKPSVLRVFLAGDRVVEFEPVNEDDEEAAKQETDITNYHIMKANGIGGFTAMHNWISDCLMYPTGYIKCWFDEAEETDVGMVKGADEFAVQMLEEDDEVEILEQDSRMIKVSGVHADPEQTAGNVRPISVPVEVFDLKIRTTRQVKKLRLQAVPGEEVLLDNDLTDINIDEADFVCHRNRKTYTRLLQEGMDKELLDIIGSEEDYQWNDERVNRLFFEDEDPEAEDEDDPSMRKYWVHECYAWFDYNGDGIAEHRRVIIIGDQIFENEETNYQPLIAMSSILMAHKHIGMSYADIVKDLQILQTTLTRQLLDNTYKNNIRRKIFSEDALTEDGSTMDAMMNVQAEFIPVRGDAARAMVPEPNSSIIGELLPVIQHVGEARSMRTGVTPETSLQPEVLQESTLGAFMGALEQASQRIEMLVRIFAETGFKQLMLKAHQQLRSHLDIEKTVKIRGTWVPVDSQGWRHRSDMTINVGLGFNNKQQMLGLVLQLLTIQKESMQIGLADAKKIYHALEKLVLSANLGDVRQYFLDPNADDWKPPEPQPDSAMVLAQAQSKALEADTQRKGKETDGKLQNDQQKGQIDTATKAKGMRDADKDRELKVRELNLKELELQLTHGLSAEETRAKIENIEQDSVLKIALTDKTGADAEKSRAEASDVVHEAKRIVDEQGEDDDDSGGTKES